MQENLQGDIWTVQAIWKCAVCPIDGKVLLFNDKSDFTFHLNRHCHVCDHQFTNHDSLKGHMAQKHLHNQPQVLIPCQLCNSSFVSRAEHDKHYSRHKLFSCLGCPACFHDFEGFAQHLKVCQISWKAIVLAIVKYECFGCGIAFKTGQNLVEHYMVCERAVSRDMGQSGLSRSQVVQGLILARNGYSLSDPDPAKRSVFVKFHRSAIEPKSKKISIFSLDRESGKPKPIAVNVPPELGQVNTNQDTSDSEPEIIEIADDVDAVSSSTDQLGRRLFQKKLAEVSRLKPSAKSIESRIMLQANSNTISSDNRIKIFAATSMAPWRKTERVPLQQPSSSCERLVAEPVLVPIPKRLPVKAPFEDCIESPKTADCYQRAMQNPMYSKNPCRPFFPIKKPKLAQVADEPVKSHSTSKFQAPLAKSRHVPLTKEICVMHPLIAESDKTEFRIADSSPEIIKNQASEGSIKIEVDTNNIKDIQSFEYLMSAIVEGTEASSFNGFQSRGDLNFSNCNAKVESILGDSHESMRGHSQSNMKLAISEITSLGAATDPVLDKFVKMIEKKKTLFEDQISRSSLEPHVAVKELKMTKKQRSFKIISCNLPKKILPYDINDAQPRGVDSPIQGSRVIKTKLFKGIGQQIKVRGFLGNDWVIDPAPNLFEEEVAITCEDVSDGETNLTWCKMSVS